mgnify:CR=1 FL=1
MRQNLNPEIWGPHAWFFLESVTLGYPDNPTKIDKIKAKNFFLLLEHMIPCEKCRYNYSQHLKKYPISNEILSNKLNLFKWINNIHNSVNIKKYKDVNTSLKYYIDLYSDHKSTSISIPKSQFTPDISKKDRTNYLRYFIVIFLFMIIIIIIISVYKKFNISI